MDESQEHLSTEQLDWLIENQPRDPGLIPRGATEHARRHLASCEACRKLVQMHGKLVETLRHARRESSGARTANCVSEHEIAELAAGILSEERADVVLEHVTSCDHCGPLLREATEVFADDVTPEETALLEQLPSARPDFAAAMAQKMAKTAPEETPEKTASHEEKDIAQQVVAPKAATVAPAAAPVPVAASVRRARLALWPVWAMAAVLVLAVTLGSLWFYKRSQPAFADQLLAQAYTEQRTMELRIPGAQQAPIRVERGAGDGSQLSRPTALLEAEALIAKELAKHPEDPRWLEARGRAELLDWNYEAAIKSYKRALDVQPGSPDLLTGLASAYFQRAEAQDRAIDYGQAIEYLGQSLAKRPDDPVALYNRAIACEKMFLYQQAIEDWEHYLRIDPNGPWSADVKDRLAALKQKLKAHEDARPVLLADPAAFVEWARSPAAAASATPDDSLDEDYLGIAIARWLPGLRPGPQEQTDPRWRAMEALAARLERRHADRWLNDLLAEPMRGDAPRLLSEAVVLNQTADRQTALAKAREAAALMKALGNRAGWERARLEELYALHLAHQGLSCYQAASALSTQASRDLHSWLHVQALLESASCALMVGRLEEARGASERASALSLDKRYGTVRLRATVFLSLLAWEIGDAAATLGTARQGLQAYWSGFYPAMRGYSFYAAMDSASEELGLPRLNVVVDQQALAVIAGDSDVTLRAVEEQRLARTLLLTGDTGTAGDHFRRSTNLFAGAPLGQAERNLMAEAEIGLAGVELRRGETQVALSRLDAVRSHLADITDRHVAFDFYSLLGEGLVEAGDSARAEDAIRSAEQLADENLKDARGEREALVQSRLCAILAKAMIRLKASGSPEQAFAWKERFQSASLRFGPMRKAMGADRSPDGNPLLPPLPNESGHPVAVLSYALLRDRTLVWVFDGETVRQREIPVAQTEVESLVRRFMEDCADPGSDLAALRTRGKQLYQLLIEPVEQWLTTRELLIEGDGVLDSLPFEALVGEDGNYLGNRYTIAFSPGLWYLLAANPAGDFSTRSTVLVVADPSSPPGSALSALPDAEREARTIAEYFPASRLLLRSAATRGKIAEALSGAQIFHFAGHASVTAGTTSLALRGDEAHRGGLEAAAIELDRRKLSAARLVVLSACSTAPGASGMLADPESLARAFVANGVPDVVASRWPVDSAWTATLMSEFYRRISEGIPVAMALHQASSVLRNQDQSKHPFYWSAFVLFGKP